MSHRDAERCLNQCQHLLFSADEEVLMQFTVQAQELNTVLSRIDRVTQCFDTADTYSDTALIVLSVRQDVLTLKMSDRHSDLYATLAIKQRTGDSPQVLALRHLKLKEALADFTGDDLLLITTDDPAFRSDHETDLILELTDNNKPQLHLIGKSGRRHLSYFKSQNTELEVLQERITHSLKLSQRALRALMAYCVCCTAPQDYREFLRGPQLKVSVREPKTLMCTASDGTKLAALEAQLLAPLGAKEDLESILRAQTVQQLLQLLDAESEEEVLMEFSPYSCNTKIAGYTLYSSLSNVPFFDLRNIIPPQRAKLKVSLQQFKRCVRQARALSSAGSVWLNLLTVNAADLNGDGTVSEQILSVKTRRTSRNSERASAALTGSSESGFAAPDKAGTAAACGTLFLEYTNSFKRHTLLLVEGAEYRGQSCRIRLSHSKVQEVFKALAGQAELLITFDPDNLKHVIITPADPKHTLPIAIRYLIGTL